MTKEERYIDRHFTVVEMPGGLYAYAAKPEDSPPFEQEKAEDKPTPPSRRGSAPEPNSGCWGRAPI